MQEKQQDNGWESEATCVLWRLEKHFLISEEEALGLHRLRESWHSQPGRSPPLVHQTMGKGPEGGPGGPQKYDEVEGSIPCRLTTAIHPRAGMLSLTAERWLNMLLPLFLSRKVWISWIFSDMGFRRTATSFCRQTLGWLLWTDRTLCAHWPERTAQGLPWFSGLERTCAQLAEEGDFLYCIIKHFSFPKASLSCTHPSILSLPLSFSFLANLNECSLLPPGTEEPDTVVGSVCTFTPRKQQWPCFMGAVQMLSAGFYSVLFAGRKMEEFCTTLSFLEKPTFQSNGF